MCTWWVHIAGDEIESLAKKIIIWVCCSDKRLLNDLKYVTDFNHTDTLEVYHSLYNKYSPKRLHFSYPFMIARVQLAVLEFNSVVVQHIVKISKKISNTSTNFQKSRNLGSLKHIRKERKGNVQNSYHGWEEGYFILSMNSV